MIDKLHTGELYLPMGEEIMKEQLRRLDRLYDFNAARPLEQEKRETLLKEMFAEIGEGCYIEPPFHSNWGGKHCHFGNFVYANFNLTLKSIVAMSQSGKIDEKASLRKRARACFFCIKNLFFGHTLYKK